MIKGNGRIIKNKRDLLLEKQRVMANSIHSIISSRFDLLSKLGQSYKGKRDLYRDLGYCLVPSFADYYGKYKRQDIAAAIIDAYPDACWMFPPEISEDDEKETSFEIAWKSLVKAKKVFNYLLRADKASTIGQYAVLLLGVNDGQLFDSPLIAAKELMYMQAYMQSNAYIQSYVIDEKNPRFGLPEKYQLNLYAGDRTQTTSKVVHYSRCIHIAENAMENDIEGTPRLEKILNRLDDLEKVVGGSGEMFWRGAFPGFAFKAREGSSFDPEQGVAALEKEIDNYIHGLQRYMKLEGLDIENLASQVSSPSAHVDVILDLIAGASGIPKRILIGSERGELASSQDETSWNKKVEGRKRNHCEPNILRPFIDKLIAIGVLPKPANEYTVKWPSPYMLTDQENATTALVKTNALVAYANSFAAETIMPREIFLKEIMGMTSEEIENISVLVADLIGQEQKQIEQE